MGDKTPLTERLSAEDLVEIASHFYNRTKTAVALASEKNVHRQAIPRLAREGQKLLLKQQEGPLPSG